ncbi:hypothetical protein VTJ49DRAFT_2256 [Mycothermus thermophilus]|uniref:Uncharacterized protein n=1 Tax=Humicola insolens TaxID=85995 RepID=A0ABR3VC52_HUMIN
MTRPPLPLSKQTSGQVARDKGQMAVKKGTDGRNSRSLLAGKALEDHLGVAVDFQVVDGGGVGRGGRRRAVAPLGELAQESARGPRMPRECSHGGVTEGPKRGKELKGSDGNRKESGVGKFRAESRGGGGVWQRNQNRNSRLEPHWMDAAAALRHGHGSKQPLSQIVAAPNAPANWYPSSGLQGV